MIEIKEEASYITYKYNGKQHRHEGPAIIWGDGDIEYCINGNYHRIEGPAMIWIDGSFQYYYVNGLEYEKHLFEMKYKSCVLKDGIFK